MVSGVSGDVTMLLVLLMGCGVAMVTSVNSVAIAAANRTTTINRHFDGDIFSIPGNHGNVHVISITAN